MTVIQINCMYAQALQTLLACLLYILGVTFDGHCSILHDVGELGGQKNVAPLASPLESFANQVFVVHVHVG